MVNIALVSSFYPETNYSRYLFKNIKSDLTNKSFNIYAYGERKSNDENKDEYKQVWTKGNLSLFQIAKQIVKDRPNLVHFQHEINMYGGSISSIFFPLLVFFTNIFSKTIVTIHGVPTLSDINNRFISFFRGNSILIKPWMLKIYFQYLFKSIAFSSTVIIVHTNLLKQNLSNSYGINQKKIQVINHGVSIQKKVKKNTKKKYLLYFGYLSKRKGLDKLIDGFYKYLKRNKDNNLKLVLSGGVIEGQEFAYKEILNYLKKYGIEDKVNCTGFVSAKEIKVLFSDAYAVVIPAEISISASGPLAQAYGYSKCILASDIGNFKEEINNKVDGILVDNNSWEISIQSIMNRKDLVNFIEKNASIKAKSRAWDKVSTQHIKVYKDVIS